MLDRKRLIDKIISLIKIHRDYFGVIKSCQSIYINGCKGMGKTVTLTLLAKTLIKQGYVVYYFINASHIPTFMYNYLKSLMANSSRRVAVIADKIASKFDISALSLILRVPSVLVVKPSSKSSVAVSFTEDAQPRGSAITSYILNLNGKNTSLPVTNRIQRVVVDAHTTPFTNPTGSPYAASFFTLSINNFYGKYFTYAGDIDGNSLRIEVVHGATKIRKSTKDLRSVNLNTYVTPGEFIQVFGQEFRVCLNQDVTFTATYGLYGASEIPLCKVSDPWTQAVSKPNISSTPINVFLLLLSSSSFSILPTFSS